MQSDIVQRLQPILRRNGWGNVQEYSRHIPFMLEREGLCIVETSEITRLTEALRAAEGREKALRDIPNHIWAEARDTEWDQGFNHAVQMFRAACKDHPHD